MDESHAESLLTGYTVLEVEKDSDLDNNVLHLMENGGTTSLCGNIGKATRGTGKYGGKAVRNLGKKKVRDTRICGNCGNIADDEIVEALRHLRG